MTIKLLHAMPIMTIVLLFGVGQAMDVFAFQMSVNNGIDTPVICDDEAGCDSAGGVAGLLGLPDPDSLCDNTFIDPYAAATRPFIGTAEDLQVDLDLKCTSAIGTFGTLVYSISEVGFTGTDIVCSTVGGGTATEVPEENANQVGRLNIKFWVNPSNTLNAQETLLFDVTSTLDGNIPWDSLNNAANSLGGTYSFTMEATATHDIPDIVNNSDFDLKVGCEPEEEEERKEINKTSDCPEEFGIYTPTAVKCSFTITYTNTDPNAPPVRILDTLRAEFEVVEPTNPSIGDVTLIQTKKGSGTIIQWDIPEGPIVDATLVVDIQTVANPGHGKRGDVVFKPTSCGPLPINDGAIVFEFDPNTNDIKLDANGDPVVIIGPSNTIIKQASDVPDDATKSCEVPKTIEGLTITQGDPGVLILDWDDNGDAALTGYNIYRSICPAVPTFLASIPTSPSSYTDSTVTSGTEYCYIVTAVNPAGESTDSKKQKQDISEVAP